MNSDTCIFQKGMGETLHCDMSEVHLKIGAAGTKAWVRIFR